MEELEQLITDCKSGKRDAQSKLYRLYAPQLFALCIRYSRDRSEAEDCLHEGFVTIFEKIGQYAGKGSFEGWMKRIVINLALEKYRVRYRLHTVEDMKPYEMQMETSEFLSELNAQQLLELIAELPPRYKMGSTCTPSTAIRTKKLPKKWVLQKAPPNRTWHGPEKFYRTKWNNWK